MANAMMIVAADPMSVKTKSNQGCDGHEVKIQKEH